MLNNLLSHFNPVTGEIPGAPMVKRHLSDLRGCFADAAAFEKSAAAGNPLLYSVGAVEPASGAGDLHYGVGLLMPGKIGDEYYMTKGHLHSWREAAEFYIGLTGEGVMLLEDEAGGESRMVPLRPNGVVYVPGHTAHRTMNVGTTPLTYIGVYPAKAGHDYGAIAEKNFRCAVVEHDGKPVMVERKQSAIARHLTQATLGILAAILTQATPLHAGDSGLGTVDFAYAPPEWQTAICLPDDPQKTLVDKSGELLYHFRPGNKREFDTRIGVEAGGGMVWQRQELYSPRAPIVRTFCSANGLEILEETFAVTNLPRGDSDNPARNDLILVRATNPGPEARAWQPRLIVDTTRTFAFQPEEQRVKINDHETITTSLKMTGVTEDNKSRRAIQLETLNIPAGGSAAFFVLFSGGGSIAIEPATLERAMACRERAVEYWEKAPLPFGRVQVPDAGIQALIDSSIRNIWQAREIKNGLSAFQVGPTVYRGLWIVDGAFLLEAATMLGAGQEARNGVAYEWTFQKPDGRIEVLKNFSKENGIVLWTCVRHAELTQDKAWLESVWPKLERVAGHIRMLRQRTLENDTPLDDGLIPPGFPDGGINGVHAEYTNPYWNLLGLKSFIGAARWLGKTEEADSWQKEYDAFEVSFRKAVGRDMTKDVHGNSYVPILMGEPGKKELPQRAQWGFCHAVYPGQIFAKDDPLVAGTMAMLEATEREGMVYGTGWDATGIWNYFASFYAHAWLWQGNGHKAAQALYAFANHASPTLVWREEQSLKGEKFRKVGDMPHNWASAEFIRLVVHLLALDRGDELHLLEGFPRKWAGPGMVTRLNDVLTPFGPVRLEVAMSGDGRGARVKLGELKGRRPAKIVLHLDGITGESKTVELPADRDADQTFAQ